MSRDQQHLDQYKVVFSYQLKYDNGAQFQTASDEIIIQARDATEAAAQAVAQLRQFKPTKSTVVSISMEVALTND